MGTQMKFRKTLILFALISFHGVILPQINKDELYKTIQFLASKDLAGRLAGSEGYSYAATYILVQLKILNLAPPNNNSYYQKFNLEYNEILAPEHFSVIMNGKTIQYQL
jgi:hypothetical protein